MQILTEAEHKSLRERAPDRVYLLAERIQTCLDRCAQSETPDGWDWMASKQFRFPPLAHYRRKPEKGRCRVCWLEAGKWTWHSECASAYHFFTSPNTDLLGYLQDFLCAGCGDAIGYARRYKILNDEYSPWHYVLSGNVEADHTKPLYRVRRDYDGEPWHALLRYWSPLNLKALCRVCHVRKCAAEAAERAAFRTHGSTTMPLLHLMEATP